MVMSDPIFSPDGQFMWTGSEWIPAPPSSSPSTDSNINLQDSMMSGDVVIEQNSNDASSAINLKDSVMSGNINIVQNDLKSIETIFRNLISELRDEVSKKEIVVDNYEPKLDTILELSKKDLNHKIPFYDLFEAANLAKDLGNIIHSSDLYIQAISVIEVSDLANYDLNGVKLDIYQTISMLAETGRSWIKHDNDKSKVFKDEQIRLTKSLLSLELMRIEQDSDFSKENINMSDVKIIKHVREYPERIHSEIDIQTWVASFPNVGEFSEFSFVEAKDYYLQLIEICDLIGIDREAEYYALRDRFESIFGESITKICIHVFDYLNPYGFSILKIEYASLLYQYGGKSESIEVAEEILVIEGLNETDKQNIYFQVFNLLGIIHMNSNDKTMKRKGENYFSQCAKLRPNPDTRSPYMLQNGF